MRKYVGYLSLMLGCTLLAGGCASKEMVKPGEPLAAVAKGGRTEPATPGIAEVESIRERPVTQDAGKVNGTRDPLAPLRAGELASAMEKIHFDFDRYTLSPEARDTLVQNAKRLRSVPGAKLRIAGHCDERGSDDYNLALSERRATAAMQYLVALGIPEERLSVIGYGKEKPAVVGHDEEAWRENRRDEFEIWSR